jgi:NAD(P)-dependent dehydrogenase (short-subunit alcohol dehydrogenase family)
VTGLPSFDLAGQVALVTGASSGIGRHLAQLLAAAGAKVALAARRVDRLAEAAGEISAAGGRSLPIACDVTRSDSVATTVATAEKELGPLSILVNNAGVVVSKPVLQHTEEEWDYVLDTNLKGASSPNTSSINSGPGGSSISPPFSASVPSPACRAIPRPKRV